jgi:hypothetical protein
MHIMKRLLLTILLFCLVVPFSQGQLWRMRRWELSAGAGPSFFFGDIGGYSRTKNFLGFRDITYLQTRFDINGNFKYRITRVANLRLSMTYAMLNATDVRGSNENREYQSTTSLFEPALIGEYYFIKNRAEMSYLFIKGRRSFFSQILRSLDFYAFAGIGGAAFNVEPNEALQARDMPTSGFAAVVPGGVGTTLIYNPNLNFGLEFGGRYAFSDFLDGYSSPQFSKANDVYYFLNFTLTYKLKTGPRGWPSFR